MGITSDPWQSSLDPWMTSDPWKSSGNAQQSEESEAPDAPHFPRMKAGREILVRLRVAPGADQIEWERARIVVGGERRDHVKIQLRLGNFRTPKDLMLSSGVIVAFYHPESIVLPAVSQLIDQEVVRLHSCLTEDGTVQKLPQGSPEPVTGLHLAETHFNKAGANPSDEREWSGRREHWCHSRRSMGRGANRF